jgi:uncharacterized protein with gpF-like domain
MPKVDPSILINAFNLPPEEAIKFFKTKGYTFSWDWQDTLQEAHSRAFTVAKVMRSDILQEIRGMVQKALDEGITFQQFRKELEPRLKAKGWWGKVAVGDAEGAQVAQLGSPWRLKNIYRTNLQSSYMAGREKGMEAVRKRRPYWQYIAVVQCDFWPYLGLVIGGFFGLNDLLCETEF